MIRFFLRLILLAIAVIALLFIFAPNIISTGWGKTVFFKVYKTLTGNTLTADKFQISWWKGQTFENITIEYPREKTTFAGQQITTDATLWQLLFYHDLGNMEVMGPTVVFNANLTPPLQRKISQASFLPSIQLAHIPAKKLPPYLGHVIVKEGKAQFLSRGFDPIELDAINLDISLLKTQIKVQGNGEAGTAGRFDLSLIYNPPQSQIDLSANLVNFPVRSIDQTAGMFQPSFKGVLLNAVGDAINVQLKLRNLPEVLELFCDAASPSFSAHIETQTLGGLVTLKAPAVLQFQIPPAALQKLASLPLQNPLKGQLKIDHLSLPLADRESFAFQATFKGDTLQFPLGVIQPYALFISTDNFKARHFTLKIDSPEAQLHAAVYLPNDWHRLTTSGEGLLPGNTHVDFSAQTLSSISANVQGDEWQGSFSGGYDPQQKTVFLSKPAEITYQLAQLPAPLPPLLEKPLPLQIQIQPLRVSVPQLSGPISLKIRAQPTALQGMTLGETTLTATGDLKTRQGTFTLASTIGSGTITAAGSFSNPQAWTCKATLHQMPTSLIDLLAPHQLTAILGSSFDAKIDAALGAQKTFSLDLKSSLLTAQGSLVQTDNTLELTKPAKINFTLTPEGYAALDQWINTTSTPFILTDPAHIQSTVASLKIPCCKEKWNPAQLICNADFSIDTLAFADKNGLKSTQLNKVQLQLETPFSFKLTASGAPEGSISAQGSLDLNQGNLQLTSRLDQFPADALDVVFRALGQSSISMAALFGPQVNLSASSSLQQWSGPVKLQLTSSNIRSSLDGTITQGTLTLNDSFHMQMSLTPDLSHVLLNWLNPLSLSSISSEAPLTIEIPSAGFSYPLHPFVDANINIPRGRIELGKLYCHNEGNINIALGLLKLSQMSDTLELWFAPLDFHIQNGVLDCERTEILIASAYQVCTWGNVDFVAREVDMILGLTAGCLKKAFGIKNLPENYVLQIPMRGPFDNVKINTSKATTKIGALLLWQQKAVSSTLGKGTAGAILGEFMNKLGPLPDGDSNAPPPKKPFPWENAQPAASKKNTSDASLKKKKLIVPDEQPIKQVLKLLK
ncbi:MAG: hypothetical protein JSS10_01175 [Verrucomicrobia bacterium]|nr:hypothetical protein [Verrucomicrobiota bacterium]